MPRATKRKRSGAVDTVKRKLSEFKIFQKKKHENSYTKLDELISDDENYETVDDGNGHVSKRQKTEQEGRPISINSQSDDDDDNEGQVVLIDSDDEDENENKNKEETAEERPKETNNTEMKDGNELTENNDFISLHFPSDDDDDDDGSSEIDNESDAYSMDDESTNIPTSRKQVNKDHPWIQQHDHSKQKEIADWLTLEIKDFIGYISPSKEEIEIRNSCVRRLRKAITKLWTDCEVSVFGSYATDLYLPGSDIDMVITSRNGQYDSRNSLYQLSSYLKRQNLAMNVEVIAKAKVPIIKFTEVESQIHIDVSFERTNGIDAAKLIRSWLKETPGLRELVLIVKQFLSVRKLNNVHVGGLGGYSIICLVYSFLKLHPRLSTGNISPYENLGVLLIEFFELYGRNFGYDNVALCVEEDNVCYLNKRYYPDLQGRSAFTLAIQDPSDPSNNISRGSFNIRDIKKAFNGAYELLINACYDMEAATYKERLGKSILGSVVKYRGKERDFNDDRSLVRNEALHENTNIVRERVYYSDQSVSSDEDVYVPPAVVPPVNVVTTSKKPSLDVAQHLGLDKNEDLDSESEDEESKQRREEETRLKNQEREARRIFWLQKGNPSG